MIMHAEPFSTYFIKNLLFAFPLIQVNNKMNQDSWITPGIKTSYTYKRIIQEIR
jgi:hypothetical protein